jgi:general secretion pathway protein I
LSKTKIHQKRSPPLGFTLVEVLVALAILGLGALAASTSLYRSFDAEERLVVRRLADISVDNEMSRIFVSPTGARVGSTQTPCAQMAIELTCSIKISSTEHAEFLQVQVSARGAKDVVLASRTAYLRRSN